MTDLIPQRLALLIDNGSTASICGVLAELERYGRSDIRLAFGDYEHTGAGWREACISCAIELRHNPVLTAGSKNPAHIVFVIASMDLLRGGVVDGFAIVSSDTDFVRLATRVREAGLPVFGFGPWGTSERFRKACTCSLFTENLMPDAPAHPGIVGRKPPQDLELRVLFRARQQRFQENNAPSGSLFGEPVHFPYQSVER